MIENTDKGMLPSRVLYEALLQSHIKMNEAVEVLIDLDYSFGGKTFRERISQRWYINRNIVDAKPGTIPSRAFKDFEKSALTLTSRIIKRWDAKDDLSALEFFSGEAIENMATALELIGESPYVIKNMASGIMRRADLDDTGKLTLIVMLLIVAGCTNNAREACSAVEAFGRGVLTSAFKTAIAQQGEGQPSDTAISSDCPESLWLLRKSGTKADPRPYRLSEGGNGTVIGRNPSAEYYIDDVDDLVSSNHLRIWKSADGRWMTEGMGSTNGSVLISGEDRSITVIEPPVQEREGWTSSPVEILPGDVIRLAGITEFLVMA